MVCMIFQKLCMFKLQKSAVKHSTFPSFCSSVDYNDGVNADMFAMHTLGLDTLMINHKIKYFIKHSVMKVFGV